MALASANGIVGLESTEYPKRKRRAVFSSVVGFSQPGSGEILTLEDLLRYIQPLELENYNGPRLEAKSDIGEGASYKVLECVDRYSQKLVAVKRIKLPDIQSNLEAFEHRVTCVLRDIEVMHHGPLAQHTNILRLLGYGWDYKQGDTIPFLVTELASRGTLKEYLLNSKTTLQDRFQLCGQVAAGLCEMHMCGISHGDLKLDNVLACEVDEMIYSDGPMSVENIRAKISDFGHSIILSSDEASVKDYRGTLGYKPPEVDLPDEYLTTLDVRKCDLWTLGLVCWEILAGGVPYFEDPNVEAAMNLLGPGLSHSSTSGSPLTSSGRQGEALQAKVNAISGQLKQVAVEYVNTYTVPMDGLRITCARLFENLLQVDASARSPRALPFAKELHTANTAPRQQLVQRAATEKQWSFATFRPSRMAQSPTQARIKIFSDFERMALHKEPLQAARAQLHIAFAYGSGFGVKKDIKQFQSYLQKSAKNGLIVAKAMLKLLQGWRLDPIVEVAHYAYRIRAALRELTVVPRIEDVSPSSSYDALEAGARKAAQALSISPIPATIYAVYHNMTGIIPKGVRINERDPNTGETALAVACRHGDYVAAQDLLNLGADASIPANDGCLPLHWLFMFQDKVSEIATQLTRDWWIQYINCVTSKPRIFDTQFPIAFHGTPLSFAVITKAEDAINVLLQLGADPLVNVNLADSDDPEDAASGDRSPLSLAARFHVEVAFKQLWSKAVELHSIEKLSTLVHSAQIMAHSSYLERQIMHGKAASKASHYMAKRLQNLGSTSGRWESQIHEEMYYLPIEAAIAVMDVDVAKALLQDFYGTSVKARDILFYACVQKACTGLLTLDESVDLVEFAFKQGCNVNAVVTRSYSQWRAVDFLIEQHQGTLLLWILKYKPHLDRLGTSHGPCPLYQIIENGLSQTVDINILLLTGADPNTQEESKSLETPLHLAVTMKLLEEVRKLVSYGASPDISNVSAISPFIQAIRAGQVEIVRALIHSVADINKRYQEGATALSLAISLGHSLIVAMLVENGAKIETSIPSAFHVAALVGNDESLKILLDVSKHVDLRDDKSNTPLQLAIQNRRKDSSGAFNCVALLLEAGANPNTQNATPIWALHALFRYFQGGERFKLVKLFHEKGAQLDVRDSSETTILHLAAFMGDRHMVQYLLKAGLSPSLLGNQKQTPLHDCIRSLDHTDAKRSQNVAAVCGIVVLLVHAGLDIPYQPYLALRVDGSEDSKGQPSIPVDYADKRWSMGRSVTQRMHRGFARVQDNLQAKKRLEQEERAIKVEGTGLLVVRDFNDLTALELATNKKNRTPVVAQLLKLHAEALERLDKNPIISPGGDYNYRPFNDKAYHKEVLFSVAREAINERNWFTLRHFLSNDLPLPPDAECWPVGIGLLNYALKHRDTYLLEGFLGGTSEDLIQQVFHISQFPWPTLKLPTDFCAHLHSLATARGVLPKGNSVVRAYGLNDTEKTLDYTRAQSYDLIKYQGGSVKAMLPEVWRAIGTLDLETASYFFDSEQLNVLTYLNGKALNGAPWPSDAPRNSLAPGSAATPLSLIYNTWLDPTFSPWRIEKLVKITSEYLSMLDVTQSGGGTEDMDRSIQNYVYWLNAGSDHEEQKQTD